MFFEKLLRDQAIETVNERKIDRESATVLFGQRVMLAIKPVARGEICVARHLGPENFPIFERRNFGLVQGANGKLIGFRNHLQLRREPTDTKVFFEKRINSV